LAHHAAALIFFGAVDFVRLNPIISMHPRLRSIVSLVALALLPPLTQSALGAPQVTNLSTRVKVETGGSVGIAGFIIQGTGVKPVLIRALGPSLTPLGVAGALANPSIEIYDSAGMKFGSNDDWDQAGDIQIKHQLLGLSFPQTKESVIYAVLPPGVYTAIVRGVGNSTGVALVELWDMDLSASCALTNVSTRGIVRTGAEIMIGGFILTGTGTKDLLVRAIGPTLQPLGVPNVLVDPTIDVYNAQGTKVYSNNNWKVQTPPATQATIVATGKAPTDDREAAVLMTLGPGAYTVLLTGVSNTVGNALFELYDIAAVTAPPVNGQVYLASLRPVSGAISTGSGDASMIVAADGLSATINLPRYTGLSGSITNVHIEDVNGANLFDLAPGAMHADGTWTWTFAFTNGNLTAAQVANLIRTGQVVIRVYTTTNPTGELAGTFGAAAGSITFTPPPAPPALPGGAPTDADAARFLTQATFGPSSITATADKTSIAYVKNKGLSAWIDEQFALPASLTMPLNPAPTSNGATPVPGAQLPSTSYTYWSWWQRSITAPDQLRQRVAYALSQILVVSTNSQNLNDQPYGVSAYYDILLNDAFGNFSTLLKDVTLNPGMGEFLDMLKNKRATSSTNPNENYAREIMQLFSIGLYQIYPDGTLQLDSRGLPVPTYDQTQITGLARVFTGWSYADAGTNFFANRVFNIGVIPTSNTQPMINFPSQHEPGGKTLLNGVVINPKTAATNTPGNISAELGYTLNTIFNHPNVGPFISRQLIQRLVTSNPSPGYIYRVSRKFDDNGAGVRGDLKAVVKAILLDYEARTTDTLNFPGTGKQQEPVLRLAKVLRAFNGKSVNGTWRFGGVASQTPLNAPTVFNFFSPDYIAPGAIANANLYSPEFDVTNESTIVQGENTMRSLAFSGGIGGGGNDQTKLNYITDDTDPLIERAGNDPLDLMNKLNLLLMSNQMSPGMLNSIYAAVTTVVPQTSVNIGTTAQVLANRRTRLSTAVHLITTSPQFATQR
jgi:uncharacterized protein (DUF1800 family)